MPSALPAHAHGARQALVADALETWQSFLSEELGCEVRLLETRARKRPLQLRPLPQSGWRARGKPALELRMHALFQEAPPEVRRAVASWIRSGRRAPRACRILDEWIQTGLEQLPARAPRPGSLRTRGGTHDLALLAEELRQRELAHEFPTPESLPRITWGRAPRRSTRRSLRLGSCDPDGPLVRIHPVLDQPGVPAWFVSYVLFHELLHAVLPPVRSAAGRWIHHGPAFRRRERAYVDYRRALEWEQAHLGELLRCARRGTPVPTPRAAEPRPAPRAAPAPRGWIQRLLFPGVQRRA